MLFELLFIFATYRTDYAGYDQKYFQPQQQEEIVEFGDCEQLPHQKTLGEE